MARDILEECGYRILEASSGKEALDVWNQRANEIDLLLTDMVMPEGISGVDLAERLLASRPGLKIIFTSGYTANEVNHEMLARTRAQLSPKTLHPRRTRPRPSAIASTKTTAVRRLRIIDAAWKPARQAM